MGFVVIVLDLCEQIFREMVWMPDFSAADVRDDALYRLMFSQFYIGDVSVPMPMVCEAAYCLEDACCKLTEVAPQLTSAACKTHTAKHALHLVPALRCCESIDSVAIADCNRL